MTVRGAPCRPMLGMSSLPPSDRVMVLPTPAAIICCTAAGSKMAKAAASVRPASSMAPSTVIVSMVPPEAQLSLWSSSTTGPLPAGLASARSLARAIDTGKDSIW